ncbi:MAG: DapH/DapD/GlmU-related protein [Candidatus Altimarinota bacterium]
MVLIIISKIRRVFYKFYNKALFKKVNCNINNLCIGPEFNRNFNIFHPNKLYIGNNTVINGDCTINALGTVRIGKYCHIAKGLTIYSHNHNFKSEKFIPYDNKEILKSVEIGDAVWIGANVTIAPGSKIGEGVIVSAGSVVFGDIPDYAIIRGNPAKIIKYRDIETFLKLKNEKKFY